MIEWIKNLFETKADKEYRKKWNIKKKNGAIYINNKLVDGDLSRHNENLEFD